MCVGRRIVDYLKALLGDKRHNVLFVGYQAKGTPEQIIQQYGPPEVATSIWTANASTSAPASKPSAATRTTPIRKVCSISPPACAMGSGKSA